MFRSVILVVFSLLMLAACGESVESLQEDIVDKKQEQNEILEDLWGEYGGSDINHSLSASADEQLEQVTDGRNGSGADLMQDLAELAKGSLEEADRINFEARCMILGSGERPPQLTEKARTFFSQSSVVERCGDVARLEREVNGLQSEIFKLQSQQ